MPRSSRPESVERVPARPRTASARSPDGVAAETPVMVPDIAEVEAACSSTAAEIECVRADDSPTASVMPWIASTASPVAAWIVATRG